MNIDIGISESHIKGTGLLMNTHIKDPENPEQTRVLSQFVHLSIQEYLAMLGLLMCTEDDDHVQKVLEQLSGSQQFNMALLFLYGIAFEEGGMGKMLFPSSEGIQPPSIDSKRRILTQMASVSINIIARNMFQQSPYDGK